MIYTVTFNPCLDYVLKLDRLNIGEINRADGEKVYVGGKGVNVSRVLNTLGMKSVPLGFIAGFTGKELKDRLIKSGIEPEFIEVREGLTRINIKVKTKVKTSINTSGPKIDDYSIALLLKKIGELTNNDIVVIAGNVPKSIDISIYALLCKKLYDNGVPFIIDGSGKFLINILKYNPFLVKVNSDDLEISLNMKINDLDDLRVANKKLKEMGALNVLVSFGEIGVILFDENNNEYVFKAPTVNVINTNGSGDSLLAGFIYGYLKNKDYNEGLIYSAVCSSACLCSEDLPTIDTINMLFDKIN